MCGIFGIIANRRARLTPGYLKSLTDKLAILSESRGMEASGLAIDYGLKIQVHKQAVSASALIGSPEYCGIFENLAGDKRGLDDPLEDVIAVMGHSRLVTNGTQERNENNHPIITEGIVGVHNGIITNEASLLQRFSFLARESEVDTEILLKLIRHSLNETNCLFEGLRKAYSEIQGTASVALLFEDIDRLALATNNGSLYLASQTHSDCHVFASEKSILEEFLSKRNVRRKLGQFRISHIRAGHGVLIGLADMRSEPFALFSKQKELHEAPESPRRRKETVEILAQSPPPPSLGLGRLGKRIEVSDRAIELCARCEEASANLTRCKRCILSETMPFISFSDQGICNHCEDYQPRQLKGLNALRDEVGPYRSNSEEPDCILAFSGGRDSSYALHHFVRVLGMKPIAYTYNWGIVTDLANRNISRMCGRLGIEHILVSADFNKKRTFIKQNINAWLKRPDLGMVPLFMAGDKEYFEYANRLRRQLGLDLVVFAYNSFEKTHFKTGFAGIQEGEGKVFDIPFLSKVRLASYYLRHFMANPSYLNSSLLDTLYAYYVSYFKSRNFLRLFEYIPWDEEAISSVLADEYDWESAEDTESTWRIGDGTTAFYNLIYYIGAGFTENDTFLSHQIRAGQISRSAALTKARAENSPRWDSIKWYCDIVGVDFSAVVDNVLRMPRLYHLP